MLTPEQHTAAQTEAGERPNHLTLMVLKLAVV